MHQGLGLGSAAFDRDQLVPGADLVPTWGSIALQVAAWTLCRATVIVVVRWLRHGVSW